MCFYGHCVYMTKYGVIIFRQRSLGDFVLPVLLHTTVGTVTGVCVVTYCIRLPEIVWPAQGMMFFPKKLHYISHGSGG
jgi:hypothetical protein